MTWSDGHISVYDSSWLIARSFNDAQFKSRKLMASGPEKKLWGSEHQNDIKRHDFNDIIKYNEALYRWLHGKSKAIRRKMFGTSKFKIFQYKPCPILFNIYISDLAVFGFCIVENLPSNLESLPQLIKTIAFEKRTHYGTYFVVKSRSEQISNLAYTSAPLGLHLDLPYYDFVPGVNYFIHL